jgi:RNA polymerase sigma factor (sigma-70 family)
LEQLDPRQARIVELRFFGGMTVAQCARLLQVSERTVQYEWEHARCWLRSQIQGLSS